MSTTTERTTGFATVAEVAEYLAVSRSHVYRLMDAGQLASVRFGDARRIGWNVVRKFVRKNTV